MPDTTGPTHAPDSASTDDTMIFPSPFAEGRMCESLESALGIIPDDPPLEFLLEEWNAAHTDRIPLDNDPPKEVLDRMLMETDPAVRAWLHAWLLNKEPEDDIRAGTLALREFMGLRAIGTGEDPQTVEERSFNIEMVLRFLLPPNDWKYKNPADLTPDALMHELRMHPVHAFFAFSCYITRPTMKLRLFANSPHKRIRALISKWELEKAKEKGPRQGSETGDENV